MNDVSIVIIRVDRSGRLCNSKCCNMCLSLLKDLGVHKITYSTGVNDDLETMKVRDVPRGSCYDTVGTQLAEQLFIL